jgi:molecular chaperone GrpE
MQDSPPAGAAENAHLDRAAALTPEAIESVLGDFRAWLQEAAARGETAPPSEAEEAGVIDLHTLLGQFTGLRHEVHLQTRAVRAQQEQSGEALRQLSEALDLLQQSQLAARHAHEQERDEVVRPLLKVLVDVYDALALAEREVRRVQDTVLPALEELAALPAAAPAAAAPPPPAAAPAQVSFWARLFGLDETVARQQETIAALEKALAEEHARAAAAAQPAGPSPQQQQAAERARQMLASVVTGYTMSVQRVQRALQQHGLEPIPAVGEPFDPEYMEVLEAVLDSGRPSGEVLEEVRRGYLWRGRLFRYAQVRVAKA